MIYRWLQFLKTSTMGRICVAPQLAAVEHGEGIAFVGL